MPPDHFPSSMRWHLFVDQRTFNDIDRMERKIKGYWWVPGHEEKKAFGILTLECGKSPYVEINIPLTEGVNEAFSPLSVLLGQDAHANPITLLSVGRSSTKGWGGIEERVYHSLCALLGIHVPDKQSFIAHDVTIDVQQLFGWMGSSGFVTAPHGPDEDFRISYKQPEDLKFQLSDGVEMSLYISCSFKNKWQMRTIEEDAAISFKSASGFSLERGFDLLSAVRFLLHLASLRRVEPVSVRCKIDGHGEFVGEQWIPREIEIWNGNRHEAKSEPPIPDYWIFQFRDLQSRFADFFSDWLAYNDRHHEAIGCYSATVYHQLPSSNKHLSLTQALDAYHGVKYQSHDETNFALKLRELIDRNADSLKGLVDDAAAFVAVVHATRNYYTHHNPKWLQKGAVTDRTEIVRLNEKLALLFQMCVLTDIGIPRDRFPRLRRQLAAMITVF